MPTSYRIDPSRGLVLSRAWGILSSEEMQDHYHRLLTDPGFRSSYRQLGDLRAVTEFTVGSWAMVETAAAPIFDAGTRRALVAPSDLGYGLSRMFAVYSERTEQDVRVFRDMAEAAAWLDAGPEPQ